MYDIIDNVFINIKFFRYLIAQTININHEPFR